MPNTDYEVIILGGGAAGLFAAFTAAQRGRRVLLLERANKIGKKILMSGGGRCNFTNLHIDAQNFLSANPHFCKSALNQYSQWDFIDLMQRHGLEYEERKHGQLFCLNTANDLLTILEEECYLAGVKMQTRCDVLDLTALDDEITGTARYSVTCEEQGMPVVYRCESVIVATGALSVPTLGGSDRGYQFAQKLGLQLVERRAGLVPFMFSDAMHSLCETLSGCSIFVEVSCGPMSFTEDMLFTHRGLSGPAMLQISNYWKPGEMLTINLLPMHDASTYLIDEKQKNPKQKIRTVLARLLPKALVLELEKLWWAESAEHALADCSNAVLRSLGEQFNEWHLKPSATEGYRTAEVTLGGVSTSDVSSKTMEALQHPGLYFVGEVLDVTGHLGGFNFQWAWSSGYVAGINA